MALPVINKAGTTTPGVKPKPETDIDTLTSIDPSVLEDSHIYVHCYFSNSSQDMLIRIWKTTFLIDRASGARSQLIHAENISIAPTWTQVPVKKSYSFLLIFGSLPKSCKQFDLVEEISQPGGFFIENISRNQTDVYHVDLN
ncbi:MAG TPA: hypothetical protein VGD65_23130 [Chryseosolibacter sp.]